MTELMPEQERLAREVHAAWRDGMLKQGREVAPNRMTWDTLSNEDHELDAYIAQRVAAVAIAEISQLRGKLSEVEAQIARMDELQIEYTPDDWTGETGYRQSVMDVQPYMYSWKMLDSLMSYAVDGLKENIRDFQAGSFTVEYLFHSHHHTISLYRHMIRTLVTRAAPPAPLEHSQKATKTYPNFSALLAAINSGEVNPAEISVWLDNDCISFLGPASTDDPEAGGVDLLESDDSPEEMMRDLLGTLGFASVDYV